MFERRGGEVLGQRLAEQLEEAYSSAQCVDRESLCVIPGEQCWILYVDALVCMYVCMFVCLFVSVCMYACMFVCNFTDCRC